MAARRPARHSWLDARFATFSGPLTRAESRAAATFSNESPRIPEIQRLDGGWRSLLRTALRAISLIVGENTGYRTIFGVLPMAHAGETRTASRVFPPIPWKTEQGNITRDQGTSIP